MAEDPAMESDDPIVPQRSGNAKTAHLVSKPILKAPAVPDADSDSNGKSVHPAPAMTRPRPKLYKQSEPAAPTTAPKKLASNPMPDPKPPNDKWDKAQPKSSQPKPSKAKSEVALAREALKNVQEEMKRAQEVQKKAREEAKRVKESMKELGIHDQIKTVNKEEIARELGVHDQIKAFNKEENANEQSLHPPCLSCISSSSRSSTHQVASLKPKPKSNIKEPDHPFNKIYDFGLDNDGTIASKPTQEPEGNSMDKIFDFSSFNNGLQFEFEGQSGSKMEVDIVEPAAKFMGSSKPLTVKKVVQGGSGLAKSEKASRKVVKVGEKGEKVKAQSMVKGNPKNGVQQSEQVSQRRCLIIATHN